MKRFYTVREPLLTNRQLRRLARRLDPCTCFDVDYDFWDYTLVPVEVEVETTETYNVRKIFSNRNRKIYTVGKPPYTSLLMISE